MQDLSTCYEAKNFSEDLDAAFRANCTTDKPDVHPKMFCLHCYAGMKHFKDRNSIPSYLAVTVVVVHVKHVVKRVKVVVLKNGKEMLVAPHHTLTWMML